jgi:DNA-binding IclR family transcriptional regulator
MTRDGDAQQLQPAPTARDRPPEEAAEDTSFARGLRLLLTVADRGEVRADELGTLLEMPLSTVYRYLRTLTEFGFVDRRGGAYHLGPRLMIGMGSKVTSEQLIRLADPVLHALASETGETALVMRRVGLSALCLHQVESRRGLRVVLDGEVVRPLHAGAMSRVLLAYAPPDVLDEVLAQGLGAETAATPATEDELRHSLGATLADGGAVSCGELVPGSVAVAVPVFRDDGIVGSLAVIGPESRCGPAWQVRARSALDRAAERLTASLKAEGP